MRNPVANRTPRRLLALIVASRTLLACSPSSPDPAAPAPPISAQRAKELAVHHFNETFAHKLNFKHPATGNCAALPEIQLEDIASAKLEDDAWLVAREVIAGYGFSIRVARDGGWTAVESVYFFAE